MTPQAARNRYVGIDPGRSKCGFALDFETASPPLVEVVPTTDIRARIDREVREGGVLALCVGDATTSAPIVRLCRSAWPDIPLNIVDETNSTLQARALYYDAHPPRGLLRFVPRGLLVPSEPLDGYAALIIVRRFRSHLARSGPPGPASDQATDAPGGQGEEWSGTGKKSAPGVHPAEGFVRHRPG
jgi:hypothetical protein